MSSGRGGARVYTRRKRVNLCPECAAKRDRRATFIGYAFLVAVAVALLYYFAVR